MTRPRRSSSGGIIFLDWRSSTYEEETLSQTDLPAPACQRHHWSPESLQDKGRSGLCVWIARCVRKHAKTFSMTSESRARGEIGDGVHQTADAWISAPTRLSNITISEQRSAFVPYSSYWKTPKQIVYPPYTPKPRPCHPAMNYRASLVVGLTLFFHSYFCLCVFILHKLLQNAKH